MYETFAQRREREEKERRKLMNDAKSVQGNAPITASAIQRKILHFADSLNSMRRDLGLRIRWNESLAVSEVLDKDGNVIAEVQEGEDGDYIVTAFKMDAIKAHLENR